MRNPILDDFSSRVLRLADCLRLGLAVKKQVQFTNLCDPAVVSFPLKLDGKLHSARIPQEESLNLPLVP